MVIVIGPAEFEHPLEVFNEAQTAPLTGFVGEISTLPNHFHLDFERVNVVFPTPSVDDFMSGHSPQCNGGFGLCKLFSLFYKIGLPRFWCCAKVAVMKHDWSTLLSKLPRGLSFTQIAKRTRSPYHQAYLAALRHGYKFVDGRKNGDSKNQNKNRKTTSK